MPLPLFEVFDPDGDLLGSYESRANAEEAVRRDIAQRARRVRDLGREVPRSGACGAGRREETTGGHESRPGTPASGARALCC
jgi:hypothetical protein